MGIINAIFRTYGPQYIERYGDTMPAEHKKVINAISHCRTEANGATLYYCEHCGQLHTIHRCGGNRHCPGQIPGPHDPSKAFRKNPRCRLGYQLERQ